MCGGAVGDVVEAADQAPKDAGGGKSATDIVGNPAGNMAFTTPDSVVGKAGLIAGGAELAAPAAAGAASAAEGTAAAGSTTAAASMPAAVAEGAGATGSAAATGSDVLGTIKTLAPAVSAGASLIGAGAAYAQAQAARDATKPSTAAPERAQAQNPVDPDLTAIRKRNALLFGLDSPGSTDLTKGSASTGTIGRATLLGG